MFATADGTKPAGSLRSTDSIIEITSGAADRPAQINVASGGEVNLLAGAYETRYTLVTEDPGDLAAHYSFYYTKSVEDGQDVYTALESGADPITGENITFAENTYYTKNSTVVRRGGVINIESGGAVNINGGSLSMSADSNIEIAAGARLDISAGSKFTVSSSNCIQLLFRKFKIFC